MGLLHGHDPFPDLDDAAQAHQPPPSDTVQAGQPPPSDTNKLVAAVHLELARQQREIERLRGELEERERALQASLDLQIALAEGWKNDLRRARLLQEKLAVLRVAALPPEAVAGRVSHGYRGEHHPCPEA